MKLIRLYSLIFSSAIAAIYSQLIGSELYNYLKPITTILIILLVILFAERKEGHFYKLIFTGLVFCLVGDILLLDDSRFILGLIAFLIAHLIFSYAFYSRNKASDKPRIRFISLLPFLFIGGGYYLYLLPNLGSIEIPVAVYISVIVLMSWQAAELYIGHKSRAHLAILSGARFFLISDSVLAFNKFVNGFEYSSVAILLTYWLAITLFAYSTLAAIKAPIDN
jgi:uncharacterized membrane protein YhhN